MKKTNAFLIISMMLCSLLIFPSFTENVSATEGDYISSFDISGQSWESYGLATDGSNIWVLSDGAAEVFKYTMAGAYVNSFDTSGQSSYGSGLTTDGSNIWVLDKWDEEVYKYTMAGAYVNSFDTGSQTTFLGPSGLTTDGSNIWVADYSNEEVYKYTMAGAYVDSFDTSGQSGSPYGLATDATCIWVLTNTADVHKYQMDGTYLSSFDISDETVYGRGLATDGSNIWVADDTFTNNEVLKYEGRDSSIPTPSPLTWSSEPAEDSTTSISMTANTASDDSPPILYFFDETTGNTGGTDSGWQSADTTYTDSGLSANTQYTYRCQAKDSVTPANVGLWSSSSSDYTDIETPTGIDFGTITTTSIQVQSTNTPSNLTAGTSGLLFTETSVPDNSGWQQNNDYWTDDGLSENTQYTYNAESRNGDSNSAGTCTSESKYTYATAPADGEFSIVGFANTWINFKVLDVDNNPEVGSTGAYFDCVTGGASDSGWITTAVDGYYYYNATGLSDNTTYGFKVKYQNAEGTSTTYTSEKQETTRNSSVLSFPLCVPSSGYEVITTFTFNVTYSDADDDDPVDICVNISLGLWYSNNSLVYVSGSNTTGANYEYSTTLPSVGIYSYKFFAHDGYEWSESSSNIFLVGYNTSFEVNFPTYLDIGDYIYSAGTIKNSTGEPLSQVWVYTKILDSSDWSTVPLSDMEFYVTDGFYWYVFSTSTMIPGIYHIIVNYTFSGLDFSTNRTFYLSKSGGPGHAITNVYFTFYNGDTGVGIEPLSFKVYVSDSVPLASGDRIYGNEYPNTYTGGTLYYRIDDYFDNQIYPTSGNYKTVAITEVDQFIDIPIDWHSFSVKNMNHSIVRFKMTNASRTYSQYLYPYEPFYWDVLEGTYTINLTYYDPVSDEITDYHQENITITVDTYYWIRGYDLRDIIIEITNTNTTIMDQIVNVGVYISNEGCEILNQTINLASYLSNVESNITNQVNLVWQSVNNTHTAIVTQVNSVWQTVNNTETSVINQANSVRQSITNTESNVTTQINSMWQDVNNTNSTVVTQANLIMQDINNFESDITTQVNGVWQDVNNSNSTIHTQLNTVISDISNVDSTITTQVNYVRQDISNSEGNITTQLNAVWQDINNSNSTIHTQINAVIQEVQSSNSTITTQINTMSQQITNFESDITTQINSVSASITNTETNITNQITIVNTTITNANTSIHTQINSVSTQITNHDTDTDTQLNNIQVSISNTETNITNQINNVNISITNSNTTIHNQLNAIITDISNSNATVINQANTIMSAITNTETTITTQLNAVETMISNSESNITAQVNIVLTNISNINSSISAQINGISASITNTETNITNQMNQISVSITNTETNLTNQINYVNISIENANASIHTQINAISSAITNSKTDIVNQVNLVWNTINNTESTITTQITGVSTTITTMHSDINTSFSYVIANISYVEVNITNLITDMNATLLAKLVSVLDNVSEAGVSVFDQVTTLLTDLTQINTTLFSEIQQQALDIMINVTEQTDINLNIIQDISTAVGTLISGNLSAMIQDIYDDVTVILSDVGNISVNITGNLSVDFTSIFENLSSILANLNMTNVSIGNLINVSIGDLNDVVFEFWGASNTSFTELKNRSVVMFSFFNTNYGLGLPWETLQIYINGTRLTDYVYYCDNGSVINVTIKDFYNSTLYHNNFTISAPFSFIDLGLTFHSWLFGNKNDDYYMISLLKDGATRWWERGIVPYGEREYLIPSGTYQMRIYDADYNEIHNESYLIVNSKVYVIHGANLTEIISGLSVIRGQLLELRGDFDLALTPDITIMSYNPPMIYSVYDKEGMAFGGDFYMICPPLITIATTRVTQYGHPINSVPMIPGNGSVINGTVTILRDTLYLSGPGSITWVNITYTDNGTVMGNTSYIPSKIDVYGQNLTINASGDISVTREIKFNQVKKFDWTYYPFEGYGPDPNRAGWHSAGIEVINPMSVPLYEVYVIAGFSDESNPDGNSVVVSDTTNDGIILERGPDYDVTGAAIHFNLLSMTADETRAFTIGYYKTSAESYTYDEGIVNIPGYVTTVWDGESYNTFKVHWSNSYDTVFRGALYVKLDFDVPTDIDTTTMKIWDLTHDRELDQSLFIPSRSYIRISAEAMGDVIPGSGRSFDVYFRMTEYPGGDPKEIHLNTEIWMGITPFLIAFLAGVVFLALGVYFAFTDKKEQRDRWKACVGLGLFIMVVFYILAAMGL